MVIWGVLVSHRAVCEILGVFLGAIFVTSGSNLSVLGAIPGGFGVILMALR